MPVKQLVCDYCDVDVSPNTVGIDVNHPTIKFTICAMCLKRAFDSTLGLRKAIEQSRGNDEKADKVKKTSKA